MAYRVAIVDDSNIDAEYVQSILSAWAQDRRPNLSRSVRLHTSKHKR